MGDGTPSHNSQGLAGGQDNGSSGGGEQPGDDTGRSA
jgi:hypothetical protein